jgi:hypothetical protein
MRAALRAVLLRGASTGLDLNFAGGVFSLNNTRTASPGNIPGWSFSRTDTNGTATALDLAGNVIQFPSRTNLVLQSQTFDDAGWTKGGSTVTANATAAPDESITADKLVEDTSTGLHRLSQIVAKAASATTYTFTVFAKASERTQLRLALDDVGANSGSATFDLSNGTISTAAAVTGDFTNASASITAVGSWYRLALTVTSNTVTSIRTQTQIAVSGSISYTGVTGSGLFLWGAQLETGSTATAYIPTTTAAVTVVLPRITNRGILVEEARTNILSTSNFLSGPWTAVNCTPVASAVLGPNGSASTEFTFTVAAAGSSRVSANTATAFGAQTWTGSMYLRADAPITAQIRLSSSAVRVVSTQSVNITTTWQRFTLTATGLVTDVGGASFDVTSNGTADIKIYAALAQLELGAFATSPIITTGAAGTRGADVATVASIGSYSETTLFAEIDTFAGTSAADRYAITYGTLGPGLGIRFSNGNGSAIIPGVGYPWGLARASTVTKLASRFISGNVRGAVDGSLSSQATTTWTQAGQGAAIGHNGSGISQANGYIRRVQVFSTAVTDAQLQALTAP